jgi:hypothetical protein
MHLLIIIGKQLLFKFKEINMIFLRFIRAQVYRCMKRNEDAWRDVNLAIEYATDASVFKQVNRSSRPILY